MKKNIFYFLGFLSVYLGFLIVEFLYALIIKEDLNCFFRIETFKNPIPHYMIAISLTMLLFYLTRKK